jgi:hypothetical protein
MTPVELLLLIVDRAERGVMLPGEADVLRDGIRVLAREGLEDPQTRTEPKEEA